jgi:hypothetical protein
MKAFSTWLMERSSDWLNTINLGIWLWQRPLSTPDQIQTAPLHSSSSVRAPLPSSSLVHAQVATQWRSQLNEADSQALVVKLGYVDGDNLTALSDNDWTAVPPLQKKRILAAYMASVATTL